MRTKLLLAGIAALFLATGAAHAGPFYKWQCGEYTVTVQHKPPQQTSNDRFYGYIQIEPYLPSHDVHFKWNLDPNAPNAKEVDDPEGVDWGTFTGGKASLNGKRCKDYVPIKTKRDDK